MYIIDFFIQCYNDHADVINIITKIGYLPTVIYTFYSLMWNYFYKNVVLSVGAFKIRRKDYNVQNVTNVTSALFYGGGKVPDNVREEIIRIMMPKVKNIQKNDITEAE